ncbi:MAG: LysM peptidoglycan-binding domain-containing protein [Planctomycetota bacterium]|jgi:nucleoid-associated protein YgaU
MQKDFKTGMVLGMVLVAIAAIWLATRPSLSTKARIQDGYFSAVRETRASSGPEDVEQLIPLAVTRSPADEQQTVKSEQEGTRVHIVQSGENLSSISYKYYGSANKWRKISNANSDVITSANKLKPGTRLIIPE